MDWHRTGWGCWTEEVSIVLSHPRCREDKAIKLHEKGVKNLVNMNIAKMRHFTRKLIIFIICYYSTLKTISLCFNIIFKNFIIHIKVDINKNDVYKYGFNKINMCRNRLPVTINSF